MKKIGLLGGSFNPPHQGHIHISNLAQKHLNFDEIWWILTKNNPFKDKNIYEAYEDRFKKCQALVKNEKNLKIQAFDEIFTIDLIKNLQKTYKNTKFTWIMGADNFEQFHLWKDFEALIKMLDFAVFSRETFLKTLKNTPAFKIIQSTPECKLMIFETENLDISSTKIRNNVFSYIIDTHCHLDLVEKQNLPLAEVIKNAQENQVKILQTICTRITEIENILHYTRLHDFIYASVGIHPCNVDEQPKITSEELIKICNKESKIIGIGETGLDYFHKDSLVANQKISFIEHIKAAQETGIPLIIHSRDADADMIDILTAEQKNKNFPALLHCFSSSAELAKKALDLGIYISISGIVTFKNAKELQEIIKTLPLESLLVETDSPYLAPTPFRGKTNQPAYTKHVAEFIAELKNLPLEKVINQTTENFFKIFKKAQPL